MFLLEKSLCMNGMFLCVKNTERPTTAGGLRRIGQTCWATQSRRIWVRDTVRDGSAPEKPPQRTVLFAEKLGVPAQVVRVQKFVFREFNFQIFTFFALIIAYFFDFVNRLFAFFKKFFRSSPWAGWANAARTGQNGGVPLRNGTKTGEKQPLQRMPGLDLLRLSLEVLLTS